MWREKDLFKQKQSIVEKCCIYCKKTFKTRKRGKTTAKFCSGQCAMKFRYLDPIEHQKQSYRMRTPLIQKNCEWCKNYFTVRPNGKESRERRFCGTSCAAKWRVTQTEGKIHLQQMWKASIKTIKATKGRKNPWASERMKKLNANPEFRAKLDQIAKLRKGKSFIGKRGGNGFLTIPQKTLCAALDYPEKWMEYSISTKLVKHQLESSGDPLLCSLPTCYKVDLAYPSAKIAIEVDGRSHQTKKWRFLDKRKETVLFALGWLVLRFTNKEIMTNINLVIEKIHMYIILK